MISHNHKCIFIHIPKCAGTSIEKALGHLEGHHGRGGQDHRTIRQIEQPYLTSRSLYPPENAFELFRRWKVRYFGRSANPRNRLQLTEEQYHTYFKFSFVRNPWARAFSWYRNVQRDPLHQRALQVRSDISLRDFLISQAGKGMLRPQMYWIRDMAGQIPLDFIGRFENLADDFDVISKKLGVGDMLLPHSLDGGAVDYRLHFDEVSKNIIQHAYQDDIEFFRYSFDPEQSVERTSSL